MKRTLAFIFTVFLLFTSCINNNRTDLTTQTAVTENEVISQSENTSEFITAVWLSYSEIKLLTDVKTEEDFCQNVDKLVLNLKSFGINTLIVHAVAFCDSFYKSSILPKSRYIMNKNISDPFGIICKKCIENEIKVEAWINPYRAFSSSDETQIKNNPAVKKLNDEDKNSLIITEDGIFLNPASVSAQKLILDEAREILSLYEISAIHIDDYFYPDMTDSPDIESYETYKKQGGKKDIGSFRRENVNSLVSSLHEIASLNSVLLTISPAADIEKNYSLKYADVELFMKNGWADIIMPQLYFGFENSELPFENTAKKWIDTAQKYNVKLVPGLAVYKCGKKDKYAGKGENEWIESSDILSRQLTFLKSETTIYGVAFFSYSYIFGKNIEKNAKKELQILKSML